MLRRTVPLFLCMSAAACGDDGGPIFTVLDMRSAVDAGSDANERDREAPAVVATAPTDGATDVAADVSLTVTFSEPMNPERGSLGVTQLTRAVGAGRWMWDATSETLTLPAPEGGWPEGPLVVTLVGFADASDNLLPPYRYELTIGSVTPRVVATSPAEGATVSPRLEVIRIDFSEPMDNTSGRLVFDGMGQVARSGWIDGATFEAEVGELEYEATYRAELRGFRDRRGTPLDPGPLLGDGALDFATGTDTDGPRVVDVDPAEGQVEVDPGRGRVTFYFDEPMDVRAGTAALEVEGASAVLAGDWNAEATVLTLDVAGLLVPNQPHRVVLGGFRDTLGNPLDSRPLLGDGALDFEVSRDLLPPFVGFSDPLEGSDTASFRRDRMLIFFSEEMSAALNDVAVEGPRGTFVAAGSWNASRTQLTLDVDGELHSGETYRIDFSAFRDLRGTPLDVDHPYLGDGALDWTMSAPEGENCRDVLTAAQATVVDGALVWTVDQTQARLHDGSADCDPSPDGSDSVIRYTKTSPDLAGGGTMLRVELRGSEANLEILARSCDPTRAASADQLRCIWNVSGPGDVDVWESYHDVGPGDYYIWFGSTDPLPETDFTVTVSEVSAPPEGDSCTNPWTTASPSFTPGAGDTVGTWAFTEGELRAFDIGTSVSGPAVPQCATAGQRHDPSPVPNTGADGVVQVTKTSSTSVLDVRVERDDGFWITATLQDRCDGGAQLACAAEILSEPGQLSTEGPAGDYYVWVTADRHNFGLPAGRVTVRELEPAPGDTCRVAIPLAQGINPVTPAGTERLYRPSCFRDESDFRAPETPVGLTWYRFTTTEALTNVVVTPAGGASPSSVPIAAVDAATGAELACSPDTPVASTLAVWGAGRTVCFAVESGSTTALEVRSSSYDGVGSAVTDLRIERPLGPTGSELSWTNDAWMAATGTQLYLGSTSTLGIVRAPKAGNARGVALTTDLTSSVLGNAGVNVGEAVFVMDDASRGMGEPRVHRALDPSGTLDVTPWDETNVYVTDDADALTFDGTSVVLVTNRQSSANPVTSFYEVDPSTPNTTQAAGSNQRLFNVAGIAVGETHVYVAGNLDDDPATDGIYRLARSELGAETALPERVAGVPVDSSRAKLFLHSTATTTYLYFRDDSGSLHVADVGGPSPVYLGMLSELGRSGDDAFVFDPLTGAIFLFESETVSTGRIVRLD